jgi:RNA polymerase sigma-70 factor (ECF subfamily)
LVLVGDPVGQLTSRVGQPLCDELLALEDPAGYVAGLLSRAHATRDLAVDDDVFAAYLGDRIADDARLADLEELHLDDLLLACACARGDQRALATFERELVPDLTAAVATVDRSGAHREDILQLVRARLFVADQHPPRIADYSGRGRLFSWLRVVVVREAISILRKPKREIASDEIPDVAIDDLEVGVFKGLYQEEFKLAFGTAIGELTARERNLLRLNLIDGLSIDEIGAAHNAHRTSAARWLREIRAKLAVRTRDLLAQSLRLPDAELDSVMRMVRSRLDLSVSRLLAVT